jgi:sugar phosphate isomerase/epimerase
MTFRLSCTSFSFPSLQLPQALAVVSILAMDGVDLCVADGARDVRTNEILEDPRLGARHAEFCARQQLTVEDVFAHLGASPFDRPLNTMDDGEQAENRRRLRAYLLYAAAAGSPGLTISPGPAKGTNAFERSAQELRWAVATGVDLGVQVCVEPHTDSVAADVAAAEHLLDAVPGLRLTLDHSHFVARGIASGDVHPLFAKARHAHVRQARRGALQCPMAEGQIELDDLVTSASQHGFSGSFAIEYVCSPMWGMNRLDVVTETVAMRRALRAEAA